MIQYITVNTEKRLINAEREANNSTYLNCSVLLGNIVAVQEGEQICCIYMYNNYYIEHNFLLL